MAMKPNIQRPPEEHHISKMPEGLPRNPALPKPKEGEEARPYVIGCVPKLRGKNNPIHQVDVCGIEFPKYRIPTEASASATPDPLNVRPNLPIILLTDSQVEALKKRARMLEYEFRSYSPLPEDFGGPEKPGDPPTGKVYYIPYTELIIIEPYSEGQDPFALAETAAAAAFERNQELDNEGRSAPADEQSATLRAMSDKNSEPQRPQGKIKTK